VTRMLIPVLCLMAATACNRGVATTSDHARPRIALVLKTLNNPFFNDMQRGAQGAADALGVELVVQAAERETDVERQMQIVENLIQSGVNALALTPSGSKEVVPAVVKANHANIPVVIVDTRLDDHAASEAGAHAASFIGSDNYEGGRTAAKFVVERSGGKAAVGVLEGIPGHETGDSRLRGFREGIAATPGVRIVASQPANWERDQGFNVIEAIRAAGKTGAIRVIGFDAVDDARKAIQDGTMLASVAQFPGEMGRVAVENAVKTLRGEPVQPDVKVRIELVTKGDK